MNSIDQINRKREQNRTDIEQVIVWCNEGVFNWGERYSQKYILKFAREYEMKPSRLNKAFEKIDNVQRQKNARIAREMEEKARDKDGEK